MIKQTAEPQQAFTLTRILANDGFRVRLPPCLYEYEIIQAKEYFHSALGFDSLSRMDPSPDNHQGLLCSASGLFGLFAKRKKSKYLVHLSKRKGGILVSSSKCPFCVAFWRGAASQKQTKSPQLSSSSQPRTELNGPTRNLTLCYSKQVIQGKVKERR